MENIIQSAYFATAMLGPGLLKKKVAKKTKKNSAAIEAFLREILGTHLVQPIASTVKKK